MSDKKNKRADLVANTYAQKGEEPLTARIVLTATPQLKSRAVRAAQAEGVKFSEWVRGAIEDKLRS